MEIKNENVLEWHRKIGSDKTCYLTFSTIQCYRKKAAKSLKSGHFHLSICPNNFFKSRIHEIRKPLWFWMTKMTLLRVFSGGLDVCRSCCKRVSGPHLKAWKFISVKIKENLGIASASAGRGYPTLPPSAEALHKHAGPGPSFGTFPRAKVSKKSTKEYPFVRYTGLRPNYDDLLLNAQAQVWNGGND